MLHCLVGRPHWHAASRTRMIGVPLWLQQCVCRGLSGNWWLRHLVYTAKRLNSHWNETISLTDGFVFAALSVCCDYTPIPVTARYRRMSAKVSKHVTNQVLIPCFPDIKNIPSERLPSDLDNKVGSSLDGISNVARDLSIRSLSAMCRFKRPADLRPLSPWIYRMAQQLLHECKCEEHRLGLQVNLQWQFWATHCQVVCQSRNMEVKPMGLISGSSAINQTNGHEVVVVVL